MLSKDSLISVVACILLVTLFAGCSQSPTGNVVVSQNSDEAPKNVVINSTSVASNVHRPLPVPANAVPSKQSSIMASAVPSEPLPVSADALAPEPQQVFIIPENKPSADPVNACIDSCESSCEVSALFACSQTSGSGCKMACGSIIDSSACSTACSLRNAHACEPKFIEFCVSQCSGICH